jgi:hypothetical protein
MPGDYLEGYGDRGRRREKTIRWLLISIVAIAVGGAILYYFFRDYTIERQITRFLDRLRAKDYKSAYALWGCTDQTPCAEYPFAEFMKDWGPGGVYGNGDRAEVAGKKSCDGGIIEIVHVPDQPAVLLWVDRRTEAVSFAPWRLKSIPRDFRGRLQEFMWDVTRNCKPLIQP